MTFGEILRRERERAGITKYVLSQRSGIDASLLGRIESGKASNPSWSVIQKIADALGVSTEQLRTSGTKK